jgi:hypothetical protein
MRKRRRVLFIAAAVAALAGGLGLLAWEETRRPLAGLRPENVSRASIYSLSRRGTGRALDAAELEELCAALAGARVTAPPDGPSAIRVEVESSGFGRVELRDFNGPGAYLVVGAGGARPRETALRSGRLGRFLAELAASLSVPDGARAPAPERSGG